MYDFKAEDYVTDIFVSVEELEDDVIQLEVISACSDLYCGEAVLLYIGESLPYIENYEVTSACCLFDVFVDESKSLCELKADIALEMVSAIERQFVSTFNVITTDIEDVLDEYDYSTQDSDLLGRYDEQVEVTNKLYKEMVKEL